MEPSPVSEQIFYKQGAPMEQLGCLKKGVLIVALRRPGWQVNSSTFFPAGSPQGPCVRAADNYQRAIFNSTTIQRQRRSAAAVPAGNRDRQTQGPCGDPAGK